MERSLFSFIWTHSKRDQLMLLALTLVTFPFLFATLELPKRIINDAIGAEGEMVAMPVGMEFTQVQFLLALCFGYLGAVLAHGLLKMRLNTMKGIVAERLLRRFRYKLISRMLRFPRNYFRTTSQGELVSMVTSEAEPMGGLMGDAVAQPVFQAGQMLIIVIFLFLQSVWFGLAGIALIPLQAWLIPMIQRQINLLNKQRIQEVRSFSAEISESAAGIADLRINGGVRYRKAAFADRLGRLFEIRFRIYNKKFFMKFLNNFITQLTPFFFYSVGGYLAIKGEITVGALVAALAAYKDLSGPWKELLTYYNQVQDMSLRWEIVTERFAPKGMVDEALFEGAPEHIPHLQGDIVFNGVTVRTAEGNPILEDINLTIPAGARVAIKVSSQSERSALADLLTREIIPWRGDIVIDGHPLETLHQAVISSRIGYAHSRPYFFDGTLGSNLMMPLMTAPQSGTKPKGKIWNEARRSGNSLDAYDVDWVDPSIAGLRNTEEIRSWWFKLITAMGIDNFMFRRMLNSQIDPKLHLPLTDAVVALRPEVVRRLTEAGLIDMVNRFHPDQFNPSIPLGGNLLFAAPKAEISQEGLAGDRRFMAMVLEYGIAEQGIGISQTLIDTLHETFGMDGTKHPLFQALGIQEELYEKLVDIAGRRREKGDVALTEDEFALLLTVPFAFTAEQIGPAFPDSFKQEILKIRKEFGPSLRERAGNLFTPVAPENYLPRLTLLENALYGKISMVAGSKAEEIENLLAQIFEENDLRLRVAETFLDYPVDIGGANLPPVFQERGSFSRAGIKRPDIFILDKALASHGAASRRKSQLALRDLLPKSTLIFMEENFANPEAYDLYVEIKGGRIDGVQQNTADGASGEGLGDLQRKLRVLSRTEMFESLDQRNQRLLAFAARWYEAKPGQRVFSMNEPADAAYLCVSGKAALSFPLEDSDQDAVVSEVLPGRLIGDLSIIMNEERRLNLTALEDTTFLRIRAEDFRAVIESDAGVMMHLLQTVSGHLNGLAEILRDNAANIEDGTLTKYPTLQAMIEDK